MSRFKVCVDLSVLVLPYFIIETFPTSDGRRSRICMDHYATEAEALEAVKRKEQPK